MDAQARYQKIRGALYRRLPALSLALGLLDWKEDAVCGTDGEFFYAPASWLETVLQEDAQRMLLHSALHAVFRHPASRGRREEALWSLACDMSVEFLAHRLLELPLRDTVGRAFYALQKDTAFSAKAVYAQLERGFPISTDELHQAFSCDSHTFWTKAEQRAKAAFSGEGDGLDALWKRQEEKLRPHMQADQPKIGAGTASARLRLDAFPENHTRFASLLRAFSVVQENRHVNDADFSYSWYAYGMERCGGMPLIEPLEYSEERRLREMVIVIDTSASCSRGLCAQFLGAVHTILLKERLFFERFRLYILQCDCEVQQESLITNLEEFQWYLDHLELLGGGGTDYRPAFCRIDELVESGELSRLGGVLYFTDGYGVFPAQRPDYPVAFVMLQYRYDDINIPRWAMQLILDADKPGRDEGWI